MSDDNELGWGSNFKCTHKSSDRSDPINIYLDVRENRW